MNQKNLDIPNHIAIILDGNGRWALSKGLTRMEGHTFGLKRVEEIVEYAFSKGVNVLSLYAFSTENFKRSKEEVNHLMKLFTNMFSSKMKKIVKNNIKIVISGSRENLPLKVLKSIDKMISETKDNKNGILNICINYSGRLEIVDTYKKLMKSKIKESEINEDIVRKNLYNNLPDVDLMVRTSGEQRLSDFMLYTCAYAEFYFPKVYWPDFSKKEFDKAIKVYNKRNRRFGR